MSGKVRAWEISNPDGFDNSGESLVVFADTRGRARRLGAGEFDTEFTAVNVRRLPEFDEYAALRHMPDAVLLAHGWLVPCAGCGEIVEDYVDEDDPMQPAVVGDDVYHLCCVPSEVVAHVG